MVETAKEDLKPRSPAPQAGALSMKVPFCSPPLAVISTNKACATVYL